MRKIKLKTIFTLAVLACFSLLSNVAFSQATIPFEIKNNSPFSDDELYVAIVGINYTTKAHVWINPRNSQILPMDKSYNTVKGPVYNGNMGPGTNAMYANCFAKLSEIPNRTFKLPPIEGCRVFISKGKQLYFYFHGSTGSTVGYTSPNHLDPTDPNQKIMFEIIELTNNEYGFFGNTSRVDAYKYPMGLELYGAGGYAKKVGELKSHEEILKLYKANVPAEFQTTLNAAGEIWAPSKTAGFQDGTNGSMAGPYGNYLKPYIDAIWEKYKKVDLIFNAGEAGIFKGRVIGEQLQVKEISGRFDGKTGTVIRRPTTQEALEGKGVLDNGLSAETRTVDLVVQAQLTAAINRHVVDVTTPNPGQQNWHDKSKFYKANPMNHYSKFWHLPGINIDELSYGFAYDDVADHSPSLHTPSPTKVVAVFGGYNKIVTNPNPNPNPSPSVATFFKGCNYNGPSVSLPAGNYTLAQLNAKGILNNDLSSVKLSKGYQAELFDGDQFTGPSVVITSDLSCLVEKKFNDKTTSIKIGVAGTPYSSTIQAESYGAMSGVSIQSTNDIGGGQHVTSIETGDWMAYNNIRIPATGSYKIEYRVSNAGKAGKLSLDINSGTTVIGAVDVPSTGNAQVWSTVSHTVNLNAGTFNFGIYAATGGWNINWWRITKLGSTRIIGSEEFDKIGLKAFPVPSSEILFIDTQEDLSGMIASIIDAAGKERILTIDNENGVNVSELQPGVYSLTIRKAGKSATLKFIKE